MGSFHLRLVTTSFAFVSAVLTAQPHRPVPIEPLLRSEDPRLIALGAWEVVRRRDDSQIGLLVDLAERWNPRRLDEQQGRDWYDSMSVVLDALIQRQANASSAAIQALASTYPDQALILLARLDPSEAEPILLSWFRAGRVSPREAPETENQSRKLLARIGAMFLARDHPEDIAANVLEDSLVQLVVSVPDFGSDGIDRCLLACRARPQCAKETEGEGRTGWPPVFRYILEENETEIQQKNGFLIYAGGDTITWHRAEAQVDHDHCDAPAPLGPETRHHLLAEMLKVRDSGIPWASQMNLTLPWITDQQYLSDLQMQITAEEDQLRSTMQVFFSKGLVTKSQLETIRPRLSVLIFDDRAKASPRPELPLPGSQDSRTWCRLARRP
jgi:hypothetical protein